ncbi:MlaE family ABC transporter permease [Uliginosibacterium sp. sgz301328]|uniref:MlaE family ABC transporter permease n=1 Tax=Uliginosibacterium sp. sgz301328 TaxID=3243764 RepID=UPI00359EF002
MSRAGPNTALTQHPPRIEHVAERYVLSGDWSLAALRRRLVPIRHRLEEARGAQVWDLTDITRLDSFGALLLWRTWGLAEPEAAVIPDRLRDAFDRIRAAAALPIEKPRRDWLAPLARIGRAVIGAFDHAVGVVELLGRVSIELAMLLRNPSQIPWLEISAALYKTGVRAMPISALLGFLIGVVLCYLSALQLQNFGADAFIVNILGIGIIRELGPMLVSVLVAGRSGSAITAQLGVMRVTEEIDALATMGISRYQRLVLPKVLALAFAMPLLVLWTSAAGLIGGMVVADLQMNLDYRYFITTLPRVVQVANVWIGLGKGVIFGVTIAIIACHYGLRVKPNTESLSSNTTAAVVAAITAVIVLDALLAIATRSIGVVAR